MYEAPNSDWKASGHDQYMKWISGFANAQGGILEVGRNNDGQVICIENADQLMEELPIKFYDLLGIAADIELLSENGL